MSATAHLLVEFVDGKPSLGLGRKGVSRSFTRKGAAENYANQLGGDVRVLSVAIPDEKPVGDGMWPHLQPVLAVSWS